MALNRGDVGSSGTCALPIQEHTGFDSKPEAKPTIKRLAIFLAIAVTVSASAAVPAGGHSFTPGTNAFLLDGKPFQIRSGELHYQRIPREYWRQRLQAAKAMGLNAVATYMFWSAHESQPGTFDFAGMNDVAAFVRLAQAEGLSVILRPGPYVCAEWDLGGLPWWLLKDPLIRLRSQDPAFLAPCRRYIQEVGRQLAALQVTRGGPILMVQVENEYGSYGSDKVYMGRLRDMLKEAVRFHCTTAMGWLASPTIAGPICSAQSMSWIPLPACALFVRMCRYSARSITPAGLIIGESASTARIPERLCGT